MKIIFVESVQSYGGAQIATVQLAARLMDRGNEVFIVDSHGCCGAFVEAVKATGVHFDVLVPRSEPYVIGKYASRIRNAFRMVGYIPHWFRLKSALRKKLAEIAPDVVVCYNHKVLSIVPKSATYKVVYYAHGWYIPQQVGRLMHKLLKTKTDRIITVSQATRMALYAGGIAPLEKIKVVHNAISASELNPNTAILKNGDGKLKLLVCGGFLPDKGLHIAVEVAKNLRDRGVDVYLIITGIIYKGPVSQRYYDQVLGLIDSYGMQDCVEVVCGKSNVIDYFRACDYLIHPSATEGLPLVVLESMALSKPVVVNAVGGVTDMVLDGFTGVIVPHNDVLAYADAVVRLINDVPFRERIVGNAKQLVDGSFTKERQTEQFLSAIK